MAIYPNRIYFLRRQRKMSQKDVAVALGLRQPTVNRHENANRSLDAFMIEKYARLFGVPPYELFVEPGYEFEVDEADFDTAEDIAALQKTEADVYKRHLRNMATL